ncbi:hypothetical protein ACFY94_07570 [Streptomyces griseorubiginosus]|uniref:hypothetical protein n=1 Tax=Streptomyces griseorubiginosus TaxID=67304 RepID=UPI0036EDA2E2
MARGKATDAGARVGSMVFGPGGPGDSGVQMAVGNISRFSSEVRHIGNVTRQRYEQLVTRAKELIAQIARSQFSLGDMALEIEPMRAVGGSMPNGTDDLFTVSAHVMLLSRSGPGWC